MKKVVVLFLLVVTVSCFGQSTLWRISGNKLKTSSYLFGTIHLPNQQVYELNDSLLPAIKNVDVLALELDFTKMNDPSELLPYMMLPKGKLLTDFFTLEEFKKLSIEFEKQTGQNVALFNNFKPFVLLTMLAQTYLQDDDSAPMALDQFLTYYALTQGVKIHGIESVKEQMAVMDKMPISVLTESLSQVDSMELMSDSLINSYLNGDINTVAAMMEQDKTAGKWMDELLKDRNKIMFKRTETQLKEGVSVVIAVGCGHLPGPTGLIALYRKAGYTVEPIISTKTQVSDAIWEEVIQKKGL